MEQRAESYESDESDYEHEIQRLIKMKTSFGDNWHSYDEFRNIKVFKKLQQVVKPKKLENVLAFHFSDACLFANMEVMRFFMENTKKKKVFSLENLLYLINENILSKTETENPFTTDDLREITRMFKEKGGVVLKCGRVREEETDYSQKELEEFDNYDLVELTEADDYVDIVNFLIYDQPEVVRNLFLKSTTKSA